VNFSPVSRKGALTMGVSCGILCLPTGDGRERPNPILVQCGECGRCFLSFHIGVESSKPVPRHPMTASARRTYSTGNVQVALFSVIALALFSVITFPASVTDWPCFRLSFTFFGSLGVPVVSPISGCVFPQERERCPHMWQTPRQFPEPNWFLAIQPTLAPHLRRWPRRMHRRRLRSLRQRPPLPVRRRP